MPTSDSPAPTTPAQRLAQADVDLEQLNATLERLWLERHHLYACIREIKTMRRNLDLVRRALEDV